MPLTAPVLLTLAIAALSFGGAAGAQEVATPREPAGSVDASGYRRVNVATRVASAGQVEMSPDGRYLAVLRYADDGGWVFQRDADEGIAVIDLASLEETYFWNGEARRLRFSADGQMMAVLAGTFALRLAPVEENVPRGSGLLSRALELADHSELEHTSGWFDIAWGGGPDLVVSGGLGDQQRMVVWRFDSGPTAFAVEQAPWFVDLSPSGDLIAAGFAARTPGAGDDYNDAWRQGASRVELWDARTGVRVRELAESRGGIHRVTFSPDGARVAADGHRVLVWDVASGDVVARWEPTQGRATLTWAVHQPWLVVGGGDGKIVFFDVVARRIVQRIEVGAPVRSVALSPDGRFLAAADAAGTLHLWRASAGEAVAEAGTGAAPQPATAGAERLPAPGPPLRLDGYERMTTLEPEGGVRAAAIGPTGRWAAVSSTSGGQVLLFDLEREAGGPVSSVMPGSEHDIISALAFSPGGEAVAAGGMGAVYLLGVPAGETVHRLELGTLAGGGRGDVQALAISPSGEVLVAAYGTDIIFFDLRDGTRIGSVRASEQGLRRIAWSPEGRLLATTGGDGILRLWPTSDLTALGAGDARCEIRLDLPATHVAFAASGDWLLASDVEAGIVRWNPETCEEGGRVSTEAGFLASIAASPDGKHVLAGGDDGTIRGFAIESGELVQRLQADPQSNGVILSADGSRLLSISFANRTVGVWRHRPSP